MEWLKTFHITHLPVDMPIHVAHFTNVTNAGFLRQQLLDGNTNFEYAFLDASSVCYALLCFALLCYAFGCLQILDRYWAKLVRFCPLRNSLLRYSEQSKIWRAIASNLEMYIQRSSWLWARITMWAAANSFSLALCIANAAISVQIGESFRRFGLTEKTKDLLVVKVATSKDTTADHVVKHLSQSVEGTWAPFADEALSQSADLAKIGKIYKLEPSSKGPPRGQEHVDYAREELEMIILGLMALRGAS